MWQNYSVWNIFVELVIPQIGNTLWMLFLTTMLSLALGGIIAIVMICTRPNGLYPNKYIFGLFEGLTNALISMPFIVLAVAMMPFTRFLLGTSVGRIAALVPLTAVTMSVISKLIYNALLEVNTWTIEAAKSFGASNLQIVRIMLKEALPAIISGTTLSTITTLGSISMMGAVGAGGIGYIAIIFGYQRNNPPIVWITVVILIIFTQFIHFFGDNLYKKWR